MIIGRRLPVSLRFAAFALALSASAAFGQARPGQPLQLNDLLKEEPKAAGKPAAAPADKAKELAAKLDRKTIIARVNAYLNGITSLTGDFVQVGVDGRRFAGKLYLMKPGKVRFEYHPPSSLQVIADGRTVAVRDRRLNTQDLYSIGQTPLKFLVQERIDIERDTVVKEAAVAGAVVVVTIEDKATFGGTSRIRLAFDPETFALKQWVVRDPQGVETQVTLANLDLAARPNANLFTISFDPTVRDDRK